MRITITDSNGKFHTADVDAANIDDARNRCLIDGVTTDNGTWVVPSHIVTIKPFRDA